MSSKRPCLKGLVPRGGHYNWSTLESLSGTFETNGHMTHMAYLRINLTLLFFSFSAALS